MCLAIPAKIIALLSDQRALVDVGGVKKEISIVLVPQVSKGDFVVIHVGYALTVLDQYEAEKTLALFDEMFRKGELS